MRKRKLLGNFCCVVGMLLIVMLVYWLFVPPYTHKFVVKDVYNAFCLAGHSSANEKWAIRADISLWDYLVSSDDQMFFTLAHMVKNATPDSDSDYAYENMMLHKSFLILNSIWGFLFLGAGLFFSQSKKRKETEVVDLQNNQFNRIMCRDDMIGLLGFIFSLIALSFCWISVIGLVLWSIGFVLSLWAVFRSPRTAPIVGVIISLIDIFLIVVFANQLPAMF